MAPRSRFLVGTGLLFALLVASPLALAQSSPFPGVTMVQDGASVLVVGDLCAPGVAMRATRYAERQATPEQWATRADVQAEVAVNADFFEFPGWSWVTGRARGAGEDWPPGTQQFSNEVRSYWQFGAHTAGLIDPSTIEPPGAPVVTEIVGSHNVLIRDGMSRAPDFDGDGVLQQAVARTAIGLSLDRRRVYLFSTRSLMNGSQVVDKVLALAATAGAPDVGFLTNQDGGGSSQMYVAGLGQVVSSGRQVGNHLGLYAKGSGPAPSCPCPADFVPAKNNPAQCVPVVDYRVLAADLDGDGKSDLLTVSPNAAGNWADGIAVERSNGTGFDSAVRPAMTPLHMRNGGSSSDYRILVGDFDGDGRSDLVTLSPDAGGGWADWFALDLSTGLGLQTATWDAHTPTHMRNGGSGSDYRVLAGDFDGDGKSDVLTISPNGVGGWADWAALELSTGSGFTSASWNAMTPMHMRNGGAGSDYRVLVGDFDGDGKSDLLTISPSGGGGWADWAALELSTGSGFTSANWNAMTPMHMRNGGAGSDYRVLVGDFDGDGKSDLLTISPNGGGGWADWAALELSSGSGFTSANWNAMTPMHMRNGGAGDYRVLVGDFNGDGKSDILTISPDAGGGWADWAALELSTGSGFTSASWNANTPMHMRNGGSSSIYQVLVADVNGDGLDDLVTISSNGGGGWASWIAVELSTGTGFTSVTWDAATPDHMRNTQFTVEPVAPQPPPQRDGGVAGQPDGGALRDAGPHPGVDVIAGGGRDAIGGATSDAVGPGHDGGGAGAVGQGMTGGCNVTDGQAPIPWSLLASLLLLFSLRHIFFGRELRALRRPGR